MSHPHQPQSQAEASLTKQDASPKMKKAMKKCAIEQNVYKVPTYPPSCVSVSCLQRTCINIIHEARDACNKLTSTGADDNNNDI